MMSEKRFEVSFDEKRIFDIYAVNKNTTEYDIHKSCDLINSLYEENEQLRKQVDNLQDNLAEICATLIMNGVEIEFDGKNVSELIDDE